MSSLRLRFHDVAGAFADSNVSNVQVSAGASSCPHAFALGVPGRGIHAHRIAGSALWDWVATLVLALVLARIAVGIAALCGRAHLLATFGITLLVAFCALVLLGEGLHWIFGVDTAVIKALGFARNCAPPVIADANQK